MKHKIYSNRLFSIQYFPDLAKFVIPRLKIVQGTKYLVCYIEFFLKWRFVIAGTFYYRSNGENVGTLKMFLYGEDFLIAGIIIPSFECSKYCYNLRIAIFL